MSYLELIGKDIVDFVSSDSLQDALLPYVSYLFVMEGLHLSTITTYLAGLQHFFLSNDVVRTSIWSKPLHQVLKGFQYQEAVERPMSSRHKLPLTLSMIFQGYQQVISNPFSPFWHVNSLTLWATSPFVRQALFASLCMGFMFLFRKGEFLTNADRLPKLSHSRIATLIASNTHFWFDSIPYSADGPFPASGYPDMLSIYLPISKGDPFGKGATRFFPSDSGNPSCLVRIVYDYVSQARLSPNQCLFAGNRFVVSYRLLSSLIKHIALSQSLPVQRFSPHSLRIGGLVTLFAADVPDNLKQLAGRWASSKSFITYARATLQQYTHIASALNNHSLVTSDHIRMLYKQ